MPWLNKNTKLRSDWQAIGGVMKRSEPKLGRKGEFIEVSAV